MANETRKRKRLIFDKEKAKAAAVPAALGVAGAFVGGLTGAVMPPLVSGIGGFVCLLGGAYTGRGWLTAAGAGMLVTARLPGNASQRLAEGAKPGLTAMAEDTKERAKGYLKAVGGKFMPKRKEEGAAEAEGLGWVRDPHDTLDEVERSLEASAMDFRHTTPALPATGIDEIEAEALKSGSAATRSISFEDY